MTVWVRYCATSADSQPPVHCECLSSLQALAFLTPQQPSRSGIFVSCACALGTTGRTLWTKSATQRLLLTGASECYCGDDGVRQAWGRFIGRVRSPRGLPPIIATPIVSRSYAASGATAIRAALGPNWTLALGVHAASEALNAPGFASPAEAAAILSTQLDDAVQVCSLSNFNQYWILQGAYCVS
jgi:hypothetical protein